MTAAVPIEQHINNIYYNEWMSDDDGSKSDSHFMNGMYCWQGSGNYLCRNIVPRIATPFYNIK